MAGYRGVRLCDLQSDELTGPALPSSRPERPSGQQALRQQLSLNADVMVECQHHKIYLLLRRVHNSPQIPVSHDTADLTSYQKQIP